MRNPRNRLRSQRRRATASTKRFSALNEMLTVILQNGKPMVVSQAADPLNDRRITIEVKATIIK
jgi:hypothetical protein